MDIKYEDLPDLSQKKETNNEKKILVEELGTPQINFPTLEKY